MAAGRSYGNSHRGHRLGLGLLLNRDRLAGFDEHSEVPFDGFMGIGDRLFVRLALRIAAGKRRNLCPEAAFVGLGGVNDDRIGMFRASPKLFGATLLGSPFHATKYIN